MTCCCSIRCGLSFKRCWGVGLKQSSIPPSQSYSTFHPTGDLHPSHSNRNTILPAPKPQPSIRSENGKDKKPANTVTNPVNKRQNATTLLFHVRHVRFADDFSVRRFTIQTLQWPALQLSSTIAIRNGNVQATNIFFYSKRKYRFHVRHSSSNVAVGLQFAR